MDHSESYFVVETEGTVGWGRWGLIDSLIFNLILVLKDNVVSKQPDTLRNVVWHVEDVVKIPSNSLHTQ